MSDNDIVILSAVRTAQGRFQGGFATTPAQELGAIVMTEAMKRAGVTGDQLDEVLFGNVIQAGLGQNVARQTALKAGIPDDVPAATINRVCVSSAAALAWAAANITSSSALGLPMSTLPRTVPVKSTDSCSATATNLCN